jgi:hypothetical protein
MGGRGVRLKYLHAFRDRTGTLRFYFSSQWYSD